MAEVISMPKLGFDMAEGTLVRWVILEGQKVAKGDVLAEIETDKATVEVEAAQEGVILRHLVQEGTVVPVNTPIAVVGAEGEKVDLGALGVSQGETKPKAEPQKEEPQKAEPQKAEPQTAEPQTAEPQTAEPQTAETQVEEPEAQPVTPKEAETPPEDGNIPEGVRASPVARRMAKELGIDLRQVKGSGPQGRIVKEDVESYQPAAPTPEAVKPAAVAAGKPTAAPAYAFEPRQDNRIPLSRLRGAIGRRMVEAKQQVPHFYVTNDYDMAGVIALRKQINAMLPEAEKISVNDFIVKAAALTLRAFPNLNASIDLQKNEVVQYGSINIGVAVAVENGLLTVVCRNADFKSLSQISTEVKTMAGRAREGKVKPDDIEGSTFSLSNLGMYDMEHFIAIINPPEAAILAIGAAKEVPVVSNGEIKPGIRMKATISVDHRVSDGAEAARFMQALAQYLEEPLRLML